MVDTDDCWVVQFVELVGAQGYRVVATKTGDVDNNVDLSESVDGELEKLLDLFRVSDIGDLVHSVSIAMISSETTTLDIKFAYPPAWWTASTIEASA